MVAFWQPGFATWTEFRGPGRRFFVSLFEWVWQLRMLDVNHNALLYLPDSLGGMMNLKRLAAVHRKTWLMIASIYWGLS
jgi:hypothetical protein